jgi:hypothetical protein
MRSGVLAAVIMKIMIFWDGMSYYVVERFGRICLPEFMASYIFKYFNCKYGYERVGNFKYLGVTLNEGNNNQIDLQERIKNANKTYFMLQTFF